MIEKELEELLHKWNEIEIYNKKLLHNNYEYGDKILEYEDCYIVYEKYGGSHAIRKEENPYRDMILQKYGNLFK